MEKTVIDIEYIIGNFKMSDTVSTVVPSIRIVHTKTGSHIALSETLRDKIGNPETVQIFFDDNFLIIGDLKNADNAVYKICPGGKVYSSKLIKAITQKFGLKYELNTKVQDRIAKNGYSATSKSFKNIEFQIHETTNVAIVNMTNKN